MQFATGIGANCGKRGYRMKTRTCRKPRGNQIGHDRPDHPRYSLAVTYKLFRVYEQTGDMDEVRRVMKACGVFEPFPATNAR